MSEHDQMSQASFESICENDFKVSEDDIEEIVQICECNNGVGGVKICDFHVEKECQTSYEEDCVSDVRGEETVVSTQPAVLKPEDSILSQSLQTRQSSQDKESPSTSKSMTLPCTFHQLPSTSTIPPSLFQQPPSISTNPQPLFQYTHSISTMAQPSFQQIPSTSKSKRPEAPVQQDSSTVLKTPRTVPLRIAASTFLRFVFCVQEVGSFFFFANCIQNSYFFVSAKNLMHHSILTTV